LEEQFQMSKCKCSTSISPAKAKQQPEACPANVPSGTLGVTPNPECPCTPVPAVSSRLQPEIIRVQCGSPEQTAALENQNYGCRHGQRRRSKCNIQWRIDQ